MFFFSSIESNWLTEIFLFSPWTDFIRNIVRAEIRSLFFSPLNKTRQKLENGPVQRSRPPFMQQRRARQTLPGRKCDLFWGRHVKIRGGGGGGSNDEEKRGMWRTNGERKKRRENKHVSKADGWWWWTVFHVQLCCLPLGSQRGGLGGVRCVWMHVCVLGPAQRGPWFFTNKHMLFLEMLDIFFFLSSVRGPGFGLKLRTK